MSSYFKIVPGEKLSDRVKHDPNFNPYNALALSAYSADCEVFRFIEDKVKNVIYPFRLKRSFPNSVHFTTVGCHPDLFALHNKLGSLTGRGIDDHGLSGELRVYELFLSPPTDQFVFFTNFELYFPRCEVVSGGLASDQSHLERSIKV